MDKETIAKVCHEVNRAYCMALGDNSQRPWEKETEEKKKSAVSGVEFALSGKRSPQEMHEAWMEQMAAAGWQHGDEKNEEEKTHPCMVPYDELPLEQRVKDHLFSAVVKSLAGISPAGQTSAIVTKIGSDMVERVGVGYIGKRPTFTDPLYGTGFWKKGEVRIVADDLAEKLLKHPDQFAIVPISDDSTDTDADDDHGNAKEQQPEDDTIDDENELARDAINQMTRKAHLVDFAKTNFNVELDVEGKKVADLQAECIGLVDQFGMPGSED